MRFGKDCFGTAWNHKVEYLFDSRCFSVEAPSLLASLEALNDTLPVRPANAEETCAICLDEVSMEQPTREMKCKHLGQEGLSVSLHRGLAKDYCTNHVWICQNMSNWSVHRLTQLFCYSTQLLYNWIPTFQNSADVLKWRKLVNTTLALTLWVLELPFSQTRHTFHVGCLDAWWRRSARRSAGCAREVSCPTCRQRQPLRRKGEEVKDLVIEEIC